MRTNQDIFWDSWEMCHAWPDSFLLRFAADQIWNFATKPGRAAEPFTMRASFPSASARRALRCSFSCTIYWAPSGLMIMVSSLLMAFSFRFFAGGPANIWTARPRPTKDIILVVGDSLISYLPPDSWFSAPWRSPQSFQTLLESAWMCDPCGQRWLSSWNRETPWASTYWLAISKILFNLCLQPGASHDRTSEASLPW